MKKTPRTWMWAFAALAADPATVRDAVAEILCGLGAVLGASRSVFLRFHGGRGVATGVGGHADVRADVRDTGGHGLSARPAADDGESEDGTMSQPGIVEGVAEQVAANFARKYPGSEVCGLACPPFGAVVPSPSVA